MAGSIVPTTTHGALKALIEALPAAQAVALKAYRDDAPEGALEPYVVIGGPTTTVPDKLEDGAASTITEQMTVDLWQRWKSTDNSLIENVTLADALVAGIQGSRLPAHPKLVYSCLVRGAPRILDRDANTVQNAITVDVHRQL